MSAIGLRPALLARAKDRMLPARAMDGEVDLPALTDPAIGLARSATVLSVVALVIVVLTASHRVGAGFELKDVGAVLVLYAIATLALGFLPLGGMPSVAAAGVIGAQILFVVSLTTLTGGGRSPYFAFYAPILALAGWHLRRDWLIAAVGAVVAVESWRAMVVEGGRGNADQLLVALPFFAAIAALAHVTSARLLSALVAIRRDQLRTAMTLDAVRHIASSPETDPLDAASAAAGRIFGSVTRLVAFDEPVARGDELLLSRSDQGRRLDVAITGAAGTHGVLELERDDPFSTTEARLAGMLGRCAGQVADARRGRRPPVDAAVSAT